MVVTEFKANNLSLDQMLQLKDAVAKVSGDDSTDNKENEALARLKQIVRKIRVQSF